MKEEIPAWVSKQKRKGTQVTRIGKNYYLYKISSQWDPQKKRAVKVTEEYLGKITEEGLIPPKHERVKETYRHIAVREYGASYFLQSISQDVQDELRRVFPYEWKELFSLALFRLMEKSPLKHIGFYYANSYLSEIINGMRTSQKFLGPFLQRIGIRRELMKDFMRSFMIKADYALIDLTHVFSYSENVINAMLGHNKDSIYIPQVNLLLIYSLDMLQPVYFRLLPGSVRDVSSLIKTVNETLVEKIVFIGDKGFYSDDNIKELRDNEIDYVFALKRNSSFISYDIIIGGKRDKFDGYFLYQSRHVWYYTSRLNESEQIITYLDSALKAREENDLALRIQHLEEKNKEDELNETQQKQLIDYKTRLYDTSYRNGTLTVRTNLGKNPQEVYQIMKSRVNIEQVFDTFKNTLDADRTYTRDDYQMEGWMFINFIAMQLYYKIYAILMRREILNNHSPMDVIIHLKRIHMLKMKDSWQIAEIPKKSITLIKKLGLDIPIT